MANKALMIDAHGSEKSVRKDQVSKEDLQNTFFCCGYSVLEGKHCKAPLRPSFDGSIVRYFYEASRSMPHAAGCPYAKKGKESRVSVLDTRAKDLTTTDLLHRIGKIKPKPPGGPGGPETPKSPTNNSDEDDSNKPVVQRSQHPKTVPELVELLKSLSLDDLYADTTVSKFILDERTESVHRKLGIPDNTPVVVLARKTNPKAFGVDVGRGQWLLADYWAVGNNRNQPILFLLNADGKTRKMLADCTKYDKAAKIAVFATWKKDARYDNVFVSSFVNYNLVGIIGDDSD